MKNEIQVRKNNTILPKDMIEASWIALSPETQKAYASDMKLFLEFVKKDLLEVTVKDISEYINYLKNNDDQTNATINRKIASLSKLFSVYKKAGVVRENPVALLKEIQNISFKSSKEVRAGLDISDIKKTIKTKKTDSSCVKRTVLIIRTLAETGLRISELTGMLRKNIEESSKTNFRVRIVGKGQKERFVFLTKELYEEILKEFPDKKITTVFYTVSGKRYSRKTLYKFIREIFFKKTGKDVHPHMLRHFFATYKISKQKQDIKAVSKYLGHSDVSITLNMYVDTALDEKSAGIKL